MADCFVCRYCLQICPAHAHTPLSPKAEGSHPRPCAGWPDDEAVVKRLIDEHGVCVIPGSACGAPGCLRVAFANLKPEQCLQAAARLKAGLQAMAEQYGIAEVQKQPDFDL